MAAGPDIRIGDAEREATAASLREHYARGRLTSEEFQERLDATFAARTQAELAKITLDLPLTDHYAAPWPPQSAQSASAQSASPQVGPSSHWQRRRPGRRSATTWANWVLGFGLIATMLILVTVAFSPFAAVPRIVILIFGALALLRRIFRRIGGRR